MTVTVRTSTAALLKSKATKICAVFVVFMAVLLAVLLIGRPDEDGVLRNLFSVAALAPAVGILAAIVSLLALSYKRRRPVLVIDSHVRVPHSGVYFPLSDLAILRISRRGNHSLATLVPRHLVEAGEAGSNDLGAYTIEFPQGPEPRPFELVDLLKAQVPGLVVEK